MVRWDEQVAEEVAEETSYQDWVSRQLDSLYQSLCEGRHDEHDDCMEKERSVEVRASTCPAAAGAGGRRCCARINDGRQALMLWQR